MHKGMRVGAYATLLAFGSVQLAEAAPLSNGSCATAAEISAVQVSAVQQELTDAALACGEREVALFNRFQTTFRTELRRSDAVMLAESSTDAPNLQPPSRTVRTTGSLVLRQTARR